MLLENGVNVTVGNRRQWTPLHMAAYNDHSEIVSSLLDHGAIVDAQEERLVSCRPRHPNILTTKSWTSIDIPF